MIDEPPDDPGKIFDIGSMMLSEHLGPLIGLNGAFRDMPVPEQLMILSRFVWILNKYQAKLEEGSSVADMLLFDLVTRNRKDLN